MVFFFFLFAWYLTLSAVKPGRSSILTSICMITKIKNTPYFSCNHIKRNESANVMQGNCCSMDFKHLTSYESLEHCHIPKHISRTSTGRHRSGCLSAPRSLFCCYGFTLLHFSIPRSSSPMSVHLHGNWTDAVQLHDSHITVDRTFLSRTEKKRGGLWFGDIVERMFCCSRCFSGTVRNNSFTLGHTIGDRSRNS